MTDIGAPPEGGRISNSILIVLAAGPVAQDFVSVVNLPTPAMLPFKGRPLIYQTIVDHIRQHASDIVVALPRTDARLKDFLTSAFDTRLNLRLVQIDNASPGTPAKTLVSAVDAAIQAGLADRPAYIVYGDIYFDPDTHPHDRPVAFVDDYVASDKYSYFIADGRGCRHVAARADRGGNDLAASPLCTDIGAYWVPALGDLFGVPPDEPKDGTVGELLVSRYDGQVGLSKVRTWSDLGHLDTATQIRTRLIGARASNHLHVDEERGLITKSSTNAQKIQSEIKYYEGLPRPLSIYFPRLFDTRASELPSYTIEYYSYRTLAEYFVFFRFPDTVWSNILNRVIAITREFAEYHGPRPTAAQVDGFYLGKLLSRMQALRPGSGIAELAERDRIVLNGRPLSGWKRFLPEIEAVVARIADDPRTSVIHGDLCFSNILYDPQTGLLRLIDPRGEFYEKGCFGDPRYDTAKLLHSLHGGYDFIVQEMYDLHEAGTGDYWLRLFRPDDNDGWVRRLTASLAEQLNYDLNDLLVLEAMLFLSMLPLHSEDEARQKALYLTGTKILNEVYGADLR